MEFNSFQLWIITQFGIRTKWKWQQFARYIDTALCMMSARGIYPSTSLLAPKFIHLSLANGGKVIK